MKRFFLKHYYERMDESGDGDYALYDEAQEQLNLLLSAKRRMDGLHELLGHVQDGSDTTVTICQDDATMEFIVSAGNIRGYGRSMEEALDEAIKNLED